jgi:hypothetical protein
LERDLAKAPEDCIRETEDGRAGIPSTLAVYRFSSNTVPSPRALPVMAVK